MIRHEFPSAYLLSMPRNVLFGSAAGIEAWCADRGKVRPSLLDLDVARRHVKAAVA
jgi:hypothetical protein